MIELLRTSGLLFRAHLPRIAWSRRSLLCVLLAAIPVIVALLVARFAHRATPAVLAANLGYLLTLQVIVPLLALILGSAVVAEEIEDRTITYLFSRPIPRASVLLGRYLATLVFLSLLLCVSTWLMLAACAHARGTGAPIEDSITWPLLEAVLLGGAVYSAMFAVAGVSLKHPMIAGLAYVFAIEGFLANLPGKNQSLTVQYYLRSLIADGGSKAWARVEGFDSTSFDTTGSAILTMSIVLLVTLALGAWRISRREYVLTS